MLINLISPNQAESTGQKCPEVFKAFVLYLEEFDVSKHEPDRTHANTERSPDPDSAAKFHVRC